jgi:hypothetical protein
LIRKLVRAEDAFAKTAMTQPIPPLPFPPHWPQQGGAQKPLYAVGHIATATFLGSPLAGCILMALNYRRLDPDKSVLTIILGILATGILLAFVFVLPDNFPNAVLPAAYTGAMAWVAEMKQGPAIRTATAAGEPKASHWRAIGIGLATLISLMLVLFAIVFSLPEDKVTFGPNQQQEIYFEEGATEQDARKLYAVLAESKFFGDRPASAYLKREKSGWLVTLVVVDGAWNDPDVVVFFEAIAAELSTTLGGAPVTIALANETLAVKKTVGPSK